VCYTLRGSEFAHSKAILAVNICMVVPLLALSLTATILAATEMDHANGLGAYVTSEHAVYTLGESIDITFWVRKPEILIVPALEIRDSGGQIVPEEVVAGKTFATFKKRGDNTEVVDGRIPPSSNYVETIPDIRHWYDLSKPGMYTLKFVGEESLADDSVRRIVSNTLTIFVRNRADPNDRIIPLKEIWALQMPGTRPMNVTMRGSSSDYESPEGTLVDQIRAELAYDPTKWPVAGQAFVVGGSGMEALREAHAVIVQGGARRKSFCPDEEVTIVLFSRSFNYYVHLVGAEQRNNVIQLLYKLMPHETKEMTSHLALIPLSKLASGDFRVEIKPQIVQDTFGLDWAKWIRQIVCESFVFKVEQRKQKIVP